MSTRILLIDDDENYVAKLSADALKAGFEIVSDDNLESGIIRLRSGRRIAAVILDGRCPLSASGNQPAKLSFVTHALQQIRELEDEYNRAIPFCINTDTPEEFAEEYEGIAHVFRKGTEHEALFAHLRDLIRALPETTVREEFGEVLTKFSSRFDDETTELLIDALLALESADKATIIKNLGVLRLLLESLIDEVCQEKLHRPVEAYLHGEGSRTRRMLDDMKQHVIPIEMYDSAVQIYRICSRYGNHADPVAPGAIVLKPTRYTYQRLVYGLLELMEFLLA